MGGAAALVGSDSLDVNALVLEAVYPDIATAVANRIDMRLGAIGRAMAAPYVYVMGPILGIDASALRPVDRLKSFKGPLLMIAGSEDRHTTITETKAMFASANEPKELWVVDGAAHVEAHLKAWGGNSSGLGVANIDPQGKVHPDTYWSDYTVGSVKAVPFSTLWTGDDPMLAQLRQRPRPLKGRCGACAFQAVCGGNTRIRALRIHGNPWAEDPACYLSDAELGLETRDVAAVA